MDQYIRCEKLNSVFKIERLEIVNVFANDIESLPGKYDLFSITLDQINNNSPTLYEKVVMLNEILPTLIAEMKEGNECVIQLYGTLCEGELAECFPYILTCEGRRYYVPEIDYNFKEGFIYSWISLDFEKETLKRLPLMKDIILQGFVVRPNFVDTYSTFHKQEWGKKNMEFLLSHSVIYFNTETDYEFFSVASKVPMETIVKKWEEALKNFQVKRDKDDKEILYYLIEDYLNGNVDTQKFARVFTRKYVIETDYDELSEIERANFSALNKKTIEFSPDAEKVQKYGYYNEAQVREAAEKAWENLKRGK